ncbi:hypothetical protein DERP_007579 [Dermatophagoides pteronyssinus]|uniref:Uncharacterized protein n=2 Tax=Dermatophagoides pteronyssinus TaxID=6956 RepID=A0ABQ8JKM2_DERPT|nr:hypothetical protein DERP_007579 [Dermatophagoides pteronyssinus]
MTTTNTEIISLPNNNSIDMASSETQAKTVNYNEIMNCGNSDDYDEGYSSKYNLDLVDFISNDHMSSLNHPLHPQAIDKDKTSSSTHQSINYSSPMNSFNPQYSMLSLSKSQIRPELYQLAFDVQTDHDGQDDDDDQQQSSSDWSTVIIDESPITSYPQPTKLSKSRNTEPKTLLVTHDQKIDQNRTGIWMTKAAQLNPTASSFIRGTNMITSQPVCCCCIM